MELEDYFRDEKNKQLFIDRFKKCMIDNHLNQQTLSDLTKEKGNYISRWTISMWLSGKVCPNLKNIEIICSVLNVSPDYLLGKTDNISNSFITMGEFIDCLNSIPMDSSTEEMLVKKIIELPSFKAFWSFFDDKNKNNLPKTLGKLLIQTTSKKNFEEKKEEKVIQVNKLKGLFVEKGLSYQKVANGIGMSLRTFNRRMEQQKFSNDEIQKLKAFLSINEEDAQSIFLNDQE